MAPDVGNDGDAARLNEDFGSFVGALEVIGGANQGTRYVLAASTTSVGRGADQDLALTDVACSRRHFLIIRHENAYRLQDLGSSNGTIVNGSRTDRCQLQDGDVIQVGSTVMLFETVPESTKTLSMAPVQLDDEPAKLTEAAPPADVAAAPAALPSEESAKRAARTLCETGDDATDDRALFDKTALHPVGALRRGERAVDKDELRAEKGEGDLFPPEKTATAARPTTPEEAAEDPRCWPAPFVAQSAPWKIQIAEVISEGRPELADLMEECSGLSFSRGELVAAHAKADFVEFIDAKAGSHRRVELPKGGARIAAGLKRGAELSIEAVMAGRDYRGEFLLAVGSGSNSEAQRIVRMRVGAGELDLWVVEANWLYRTLALLPGFASSTLNIEGVAAIRAREGGAPIVRLCQRGNGKPRTNAPVTSATVDIHQTVLIGYLERCRQNPNAQLGDDLTNVRRYDLGALDGVRLGFSDACGMGDERMLYVAVAEDCPDVGISGPNHGTLIGIIDGDGQALQAPIRESDGSPTNAKVAAVTIDDRGRIYVALQATKTLPARLCRLKVSGAPI